MRTVVALVAASLSAVAAALLSFYALRWAFVRYLQWQYQGRIVTDFFGAEGSAILLGFLFGIVTFTITFIRLRRVLD